MRAITAVFAGAALALISCSPGDAAQESPQASYTKDRLSDEQMEALVAAPIDLARKGDLDAAKASFDKLLRQTDSAKDKSRLAIADLLTSFGVKLYVQGLDSDDDRMRLASLAYLREAVGAYRAALGSRHPEVAVALNSYADAITETHAPVPPDEVEAIEREALDIRLAAFGEANSETRSSYASLANYLASQARSPSDRYAMEAEQLYHRNLAFAVRDGSSGPDTSVAEIYLDLARLYALDSTADRSLREAKLAEREIRRQSAGAGICVQYNAQRERLHEALKTHGHIAAANSLEREGGLEAMLEC